MFKFSGAVFGLDDRLPVTGQLLYHDNTPELWVSPESADGKPILAAKALSGQLDQARFSSDGKWIAFNANESGRNEVYVVPFPPTGDKWQVSQGGGMQPMWRADGRELYFLTPDSTLMAADLKTSSRFEWAPPHPLFNAGLNNVTPQVEQYAAAPDGSRFLFVKSIDASLGLSATVVTNWTGLLKK